MKAIVVSEFGDPDVMKVAQRELAGLGDGEVLVLVKAVGVNPVDTYIRAGTYPRLPELPYTPGGNVAGTIEACGPGVTNYKVGDRVYSASTLSGAYAEKTICSADDVFSLPSSLSFAQGTALGVPAATAWRGLFIRGEAKAGESVFIHGASGSVGQAAIQLAKGAGLQVYGTAGSDQGCALIEKLGAKAFNHNRDDYGQALLEAAGGGFDLILEMLANRNLEMDLNLLAPHGRVVIIGSRGRIEIDPRATMGKETDIRGLALFNATREEMRETHEGLAEAMQRSILSPAISQELSLDDAPLAHEQVMKDGNGGKIVLIP
jgi:NADPH2:quinone reductase